MWTKSGAIALSVLWATACECKSDDPRGQKNHPPDVVMHRVQSAWTGTVIEVAIPSTWTLDVAAYDQAVRASEALSRMAFENRACINGAFYDAEGHPMGWVVVGGKQKHRLTRMGGTGVFLEMLQGSRYRIVHRDTLATIDPASMNTEAINTASIRTAIQSIDRLVEKRKNLVAYQQGAKRASRSVMAIDFRGKVYLIVAYADAAIDHQQGKTTVLAPAFQDMGPTMHEMAEWIVESDVNFQYAIGMDGGPSAMFSYKHNGKELQVKNVGSVVQLICFTPDSIR